jgi:hypothetical protein
MRDEQDYISKSALGYYSCRASPTQGTLVTMSPPNESFPDTNAFPPGRPRSVTVVSILGIIFGALGCVCLVGSFVMSMTMGNAQQNAQMAPELMTFGIITGVAGLVLSIVLLFGSIGALGLKPWARQTLIAFAIVDLMYDVAKLVLNMVWAIPRMEPIWRNAPEFRNNPKMNIEQGVRFARIFAQGIAVSTAVISIVFALIVLVVMTRPRTKAAFDAGPGMTM